MARAASASESIRQRFMAGEAVTADTAVELGRSRSLVADVRHRMEAEGHKFKRVGTGSYELVRRRASTHGRRPKTQPKQSSFPELGSTMTVAALALGDSGIEVTLRNGHDDWIMVI